MSWPPLKNPSHVAIAIPASVVSDVPHLREKTAKIGVIGRAAAIYRVEDILVYRDRPDVKRFEEELVLKILQYMETPQYLRRKLFPLSKELKYVGVLPPLRTPHHPVEGRVRDLKPMVFREGVVVKSDDRGSSIDIGVEKTVSTATPNLPVGRRVTVKVHKVDGEPYIKVVKRSEVDVYWGYIATLSHKPLGETVKSYKADLVIAASKLGSMISDVAKELVGRWRTSKKTIILFGSPSEGLKDILLREELRMEDVADFVVNTIPDQACETVRTEEAIHATLAIINILTRLV